MSVAHQPVDMIAEIEVLDNSALGNASLDAEGWAYVAVWTEAVTVTVRRFGADDRIAGLEWGRP